MGTDWDDSAEAWIDFVDDGDANRTYVLDPAMLALCGDIKGLAIADVGCGEGRFCRILSDLGARTTGIEPTEALFETAIARHPEGIYIQAPAEQIPVESDAFDIVVSVLALVDIPDYRTAIKEMTRILRPGGRLLVANSSPWNTASPYNGWYRDDEKRKIHWPMDHYMVERATEASWAGIHVVNYHRPLSSYMDAFLSEDLILRKFIEPQPAKEALIYEPGLIDGMRVPFFVVMEWLKPSNP